MKKLSKIILLIICLCMLTIRVNAALNCGDTHINEGINKNTGWNVKMPICNWKKAKGTTTKSGYATYAAAYAAKTSQTLTEYEGSDGKPADGLKAVPNWIKADIYANYKCSHSESASTKKTSCSRCIYDKSAKKCEPARVIAGCGCIKSGTKCSKNPTSVETLYCKNKSLTLSGEDCSVTSSGETKVTKELKAGDIKYAKNKYYKDGECTITYSLKAPKYKCIVTTGTYEACTPTFNVEGATAYCVNPTLKFPKSSGKNYTWDKTFDVNNCVNSYNTVDCGYANILIEGKKNGVSDRNINTALRLWAAYAGQKGYSSKSGIASVVGDGCGTSVLFTVSKGETDINVYSRSVSYIISLKRFKSIVEKHVSVTKGMFSNKDYRITCTDSLGLRIMCSNGNDHMQAIELLYNTITGNNNFKKHLEELSGGKDTTPTSANVVLNNTTDKKFTTKVEFEEITNSTEKGLVIDCDELKKNPKDPNYNSIMPYCQTKVQLFDANNNKLTSNVDMEKCIKGEGCYSKVMSYAICDKNTTKTTKKIVVTYKATQSSKTIRKYYACKDKTKYQYLFAFHETPSTTTTQSETAKESFEVYNYICDGKSTCTDYSPKTSMTGGKFACKKSGSDPEYIKDPSLNCIVNMPDNENKNYYDYSDYFGLNSNLCKVYCSDEVYYTLTNPTTVKSGLVFYYDVKFTEAKNDSKALLSSVIKLKRNCVSEIYYSKDLPYESKNALMKQYGLLEGLSDKNKEKMKSSITNWTTLFKAVVKKSESEGKRGENAKQLIYDLYNCNLFKGDKEGNFTSIATSGVKSITIAKPKDNKTGVAYDSINATYSSDKNYGIGIRLTTENGKQTSRYTCSMKNKTCINLSSITYEGGAEIHGDEKSRVGNDSPISIGQVTGTNNIGKVKYCKDCLKYDKSTKNNYDYGKLFTTTTSATSKITYHNRSTDVSVNVPANNYAYFSIVTEVGFYNNSLFKIHPFDGYVSKVKSSEYKAKNSNYLFVEKYHYPISKNAYNDCYNEKTGENKCTVTQNFSTIETYYRKAEKDDFKTMLSKSKTFSCYYEPEPPTVVPPVDGFDNSIYRNVDLSNLFPSNEIPKNWATTEGTEAMEEIQNTSSDFYTNDTYYLEYSVTLSPEQIKNINEKYNKGLYYDNTINESSCILDTDNNIYTSCKSKVLTEIMKSSEKAANNEGAYGTFDQNYKGVSKYTQNKKKTGN